MSEVSDKLQEGEAGVRGEQPFPDQVRSTEAIRPDLHG